jgi:hypothetical protein
MEQYLSFCGTDLYNDSGIFNTVNGKRSIEWGEWTSFATKYTRGGTYNLPQWSSGVRPWGTEDFKPVAIWECNCVNVEGPYDPNAEHAPTGTQPGSTDTKDWWTAAGTYIAGRDEIDEFYIFDQNKLWDTTSSAHPLTHQGVASFAASVT